ncbi:MAG: diguanylate cyclase domain-containing protein [Solirubrobacteraceae bacterium]
MFSRRLLLGAGQRPARITVGIWTLVALLAGLDLALPALTGAPLGWMITLSCTLIASGMAIVAVRGRLETTLALNAERMTTIVALHREVERAEFDVQDVVLGILERARTLLGASAASAGIIEGEQILYRYRTGPGRESGVVISTPRAASLSGVCVSSGEAVYCEDSETDSRADRIACRTQGLRSMIIVPLRHRGEVVGVLNINSPEPRAFTANDVGTVQLIAGAIAAAYGHAVDLADKQQLLEELERTVAALRESETKLSRQALHDPLTGLPNRTLLLDRLRMALAERGEPRVAVLFIDLDGFKRVNDTLGHDAGDALLVTAAQRIDHVVRDCDTAARLGGDEFAVICKDRAPLAAATHIAERLIEALKAPFPVAGHDVRVSASVGIAAHGGPAESLLHDADVAMYHAKATGKARYTTFRPAMQTDTQLAREHAAADRRPPGERRERLLDDR